MIHVQLTKFRKPSVLTEGFLFLILLTLFSCATNQNFSKQAQDVEQHQKTEHPSEQEIPGESRFKWQKVENAGWAEYFLYENKDIPLRYHCIKIDLSDKNLSILTFPTSKNEFSQKNDKVTDFFTGLTAKDFSEKTNSIISINASPYKGKFKSSKLSLLTSPRKIVGIHIVNKEILSPPVRKYSAICFKKTKDGFVGEILKKQESANFTEYDFAFAGFFTILKDFQKESFPVQKDDSRTAVGLSQNGQTLYLLTVEGEKRSESTGLSYQKCADIMLALGASDAIQLDGGGSTTLFINGKNCLSYTNNRKNAVFIGFSNK